MSVGCPSNVRVNVSYGQPMDVYWIGLYILFHIILLRPPDYIFQFTATHVSSVHLRLIFLHCVHRMNSIIYCHVPLQAKKFSRTSISIQVSVVYF